MTDDPRELTATGRLTPRELAAAVRNIYRRGIPGAMDADVPLKLARELDTALDALDAARKEPDERLVACDRAFREAWDRAEAAEAEAEKWRTLYGQAFNDADTLKAERDRLAERANGWENLAEELKAEHDRYQRALERYANEAPDWLKHIACVALAGIEEAR